MMRDTLEHKAAAFREYVGLAWSIASLLAIAFALGYGIWSLFEGLGFNHRETTAILVTVILVDNYLRRRKEKQDVGKARRR